MVGVNSLILSLSHTCLEIFQKFTKLISLTMEREKGYVVVYNAACDGGGEA